MTEFKPDERMLRAHLEGAPFQIGVIEGKWDVILDPDLKWPEALFWVAAAKRKDAPDRYYIKFDCTKYPIDPLTGTFWDPKTRGKLESNKRPIGAGQVAKVFRTDWKNGDHLYHPYDRAARDSHTNWPQQYPYWVWDEKHTIVDVLSVIYDLLHSAEYEGTHEAA